MTNIKIITDEFNSKSELYKDYGQAVNTLLISILDRRNYKYQISHRIKSLDSLKEKIKRKKQVGKIYRHLSDIEDITGIRIVFYTEADRKNFVKDLAKALEHTLRIEENHKSSGYCSTHAIISFGTDRTKLEEYHRFKGLKCEVQMTLILNHAWAEVEHDIFYKEGSKTQQLNKKSYTALKEKMESVMRDYIQKASTGLESIIHNIRSPRLRKIDIR